MHDYAWSCLLSVNVNAWSAARSKHAGDDSWGKCLYQTSVLPAQLIAEYPDESPGKQLGSIGLMQFCATQNETKWAQSAICIDMSAKTSNSRPVFAFCCGEIRIHLGPAGLNRFKMIQTCIRQVQFCLGTPTCQASTFTAPSVECGTWCLKHLGTVSRPNCRTSCKNREREREREREGERGRETVQWGVQYLLSIFQYWYVWYVRYRCSWVGNEGSNGR